MAQASASASKDPGWHSPSFSPSLDFLVDVGLEQPDALARTTVTISSAGDADGEPDAAERRKPSSSSESFYVMLVDELVRTVKDKGERHLLSPSEFDALERFQALSYGARYVFTRLYMRKQSWHRLSALKERYEQPERVHGRELDVLEACRDLSSSPAGVHVASQGAKGRAKGGKGKERANEPIDVDEVIVIDDSDDDEGNGLDTAGGGGVPSKMQQEEEDAHDYAKFVQTEQDLATCATAASDALSLLSADEIASLAQRMNVKKASSSSRAELTKRLLDTGKQATLSFFATPVKKKSPSPPTKKNGAAAVGIRYDAQGNKLKQSALVVARALDATGPVVRLSPSIVALFNRLALIWLRTPFLAPTLPSSSSRSAPPHPLTSSLLARFGKRTYPTYVVQRSFDIFASRAQLTKFEHALMLVREAEEALGEINWDDANRRDKDARTDGLRKVVQLLDQHEETWRRTCDESRELGNDENERYYRMSFSPGWPLTKLMYKATYALARLHDHRREAFILRALLAQRTFRRGKRGEWYDRLALVVMRYPEAALAAADDDDDEKGEKDRRLREARQICLDALQDPWTHAVFRPRLERRLARIESLLRLEQRTAVSTTTLRNARDRVMEGERLDAASQTTGASVWRARDGAEISVEQLALEQYAVEGWRGHHSENGVLRMIFTLLFWDVLFAPVDGVFETPYQTAPLDLATDAFAVVRHDLVTARLAQIRAGKASEIVAMTDDVERPRKTFALAAHWDRYARDDLVEITDCLGGAALAEICQVFAEDYGERSGGMPDLCLWKPDERKVLFSEVKSPLDRLSETQKVWIDVLLRAGVDVEVCRVVTSDEAVEAEASSKRKRRAATLADDDDVERAPSVTFIRKRDKRAGTTSEIS